jgi:hypothetical protein
LQGVPRGAVGYTHVPVVLLHIPVMWQPSGGGHETERTPIQDPVATMVTEFTTLWHVYVSQRLGPVQGVPTRGVVAVHVPVPD